MERSVFALNAAQPAVSTSFIHGVSYTIPVISQSTQDSQLRSLLPAVSSCLRSIAKTLFCPLWKYEKRWYANASPKQQALAKRLYVACYAIALSLIGKSLKKHIASYDANRGMDFYHDVHDWLGGYPYESMSPRAVDWTMREEKFTHVRSFALNRAMPRIGVLGSGCDEYVYRL